MWDAAESLLTRLIAYLNAISTCTALLGFVSFSFV